MQKLKFSDLEFKDEGNKIVVNLLRHFYFDVPKHEIVRIGSFKIEKNAIIFNSSEKWISKKFNFLLSKEIKNLKSRITGRNAVYVHKNSGIPLIGNAAFGIVYRNTSIIEIKPMTGCNLNCIYCSVDEGQSSRKITDFIVEKDYLVEELKRLIEFIDEKVEIHIGMQGEPLLYAPLKELIRDISEIKNVVCISMDTNGTLLNEEIVSELADAGLTRFNLSLNAMNPEIAKRMAGCNYSIEYIKNIAATIAKKCDLIIAPVWLPGFNDSEIEELIKFAIEINKRKQKVKIGIQNFLNYKYGRNPVKQTPWNVFYSNLKKLEEKLNIRLILDEKDFDIKKTHPLPKPFKKGEIVKARIMCAGQHRNEMLGVAKGRSIEIMNCSEDIGKEVKVKITRTKHSIFNGILVK